MKVRIGVADTDRVVEVEVDDPSEMRRKIDAAFFGGDAILWFEDTRRRLVGIPRERIAFIELEQEPDARSVGFT
ncbi:MAG TPA: DUF3107 family protein, partial [Acidimicrobiia bacterium]|nr:DUF3107 family protein [Acidimicrobiia bacterium]